MTKARILLADNTEDSLKAWGALLTNEGYQVVASSSIPEVYNLIQNEIFDLAVLDLHWNNDADEDDLSGFELARDVSRTTPCIFLTGGANAKNAVKALREHRRGGAAAVDFVMKKEGAEALLEAVKAAIIPRVFIVHGHDGEAVLAVERFLERIGTQPIVLRDLPGSGLAILEKFERYSNVSFAVVLITPDDFGGKKTDSPSSRPRARQNVIFELGFFIGKLGRKKVTVLQKPGEDHLEWPSDYSGIQYIPMDSAKGWQLELAKEMRAIGMEVDLSGL